MKYKNIICKISQEKKSKVQRTNGTKINRKMLDFN